MTRRTTRLRRRRFFLLRVADEVSLDIRALFRADIAVRTGVQCSLLCPVRGESLPLTADELAIVMAIPSDRWTSLAQIDSNRAAHPRLLELAQRGILLSDPAPKAWSDLANAEDALQRMQWLDIAAVYHAHTGWRGIRGTHLNVLDDDMHTPPFEKLRQLRGDPPPHFERRMDALTRTPLTMPRLDGPFFDVLLARQTTRAFRTREPLPIAALETMLYAVFGTHGIRHEVGLSGLKRTSPSAGSLHPIEAYILAVQVNECASGLYHYETGTHSLALLERMDEAAARKLASEFTAGQAHFAEAHALVIHVARFHRNFWKYARHDKAYKAVLMDSAHLSQSFYLTATHLGLGAFCTAAINDVDIGERLKLRPHCEAAIAVNGVGIPDISRKELDLRAEPYDPAASRGHLVGDTR